MSRINEIKSFKLLLKENHYSMRKGNYPYDNFVTSNMSERGYERMVGALKEFVKQEEKVDTSTKIDTTQKQV